MVLVGIGTDDTDADITTLSKKILSLRVFDDPKTSKMWKASVKDIDGEILCVSQFTLMANTMKSNKPDFHLAMSTEISRQMYAKFLDSLKSSYHSDKIQDGRFCAMMSVSLTNEGPVTFTVDSRKFQYVDSANSSSGNLSGSAKSTNSA